ncbi:MqnA/MqnD/SBP family protein [Ferroplasma sp.]|uniref:menaquinone biosynthesis family protein n=1 Tax=Ferroplasma sp. TaxID=2591003 RepID=UPI00307E0B9E
MKMIIAHTPDPDDAFMFYAMFEHKIETSFDYEQVVKDIETLNRESVDANYDVTAISANGYMHVADKYDLTTSGASFGLTYGPLVIAKNKIDLKGKTIATPGKYTSAELLYRMFAPEAGKFKEIRFDKIVNSIMEDEVDAGIIIHDEQLTFQNKGLVKVLSLYDEWKKYAGDLPIPLGFNAIKKDMPLEYKLKYKTDFENSIKYAKEHETDAVKYAMKYSRYDDFELERKFILMYVNDLSIDFGETGRKALDLYYKRAAEKNIIKPFKPVIV